MLKVTSRASLTQRLDRQLEPNETLEGNLADIPKVQVVRHAWTPLTF